jgi:integrase
MATLVRPWQVRYVKDGKRVPKGTPGAKKVKERAHKWYGQGIPGLPPKKRVPLASDKTVARQMLAELERDGERGKVKLPTAAEKRRTLADHLADYERFLLGKGDGAKHTRDTAHRVKIILKACEADDLADLQPSAVVEALAGLREPDGPADDLPPGMEDFTKDEVVSLLGCHPHTVARVLRRLGLEAKGNGKARRYPRATVEALRAELCQGRGISTSNHYLTAMKGFTRWLVRDGRAAADPLAFLPRQNAQTDIWVKRRCLSPKDFAAVLAAALAGKALHGLSGPDRAVLYRVAARTGLRASELASLTPASFDLDDKQEVTVEAAYSKHRRKDVVPLHADLLAVLPGFLKGRASTPSQRNEPLWPGNWPQDGAEMLQHDLRAAGVPFVDEDGRVYDFHALRHQFISDMVAAGVHPKHAKVLARHSTITLTMDRYAHVGLADVRAALDRVPSVDGDGQAQYPDRNPPAESRKGA